MRLHTIPYLPPSPPACYGVYISSAIALLTAERYLLVVWRLADILLYNGRGFWTFLAFEDGWRCRFQHYNHHIKGWKLVLETIYFEGWCISKEVEKVLKVKPKVRGSKSGLPTDDLLWSSGRLMAILGVRTPGRPLNLHAEHQKDQSICHPRVRNSVRIRESILTKILINKIARIEMDSCKYFSLSYIHTIQVIWQESMDSCKIQLGESKCCEFLTLSPPPHKLVSQ